MLAHFWLRKRMWDSVWANARIDRINVMMFMHIEIIHTCSPNFYSSFCIENALTVSHCGQSQLHKCAAAAAAASVAFFCFINFYCCVAIWNDTFYFQRLILIGFDSDWPRVCRNFQCVKWFWVWVQFWNLFIFELLVSFVRCFFFIFPVNILSKTRCGIWMACVLQFCKCRW